MSYLINKMLKEFDESLLTGMALVDLEKAVDTIIDKVLLQNLKAFNLSE